ncbi:bifunctional polysaccharide deacetylase/glycosyltransferase family 2 protein [Phytohabitans houttuyneae]|uniref:Bi-functional transferase/deacetylase n=1 Tax=Phytohabitans houttuyneae TaxID=1076126 RepID=A0A6V8K9D8_9ACTN|nr:bifunctional polysaccharide deacetylase/glycosyltransferase family 2 protein [Phytohabitans houttuyneae]GFJ81793.1 bi-functional transferase/deacetylase [Phytohabitans houttuyneae]
MPQAVTGGGPVISAAGERSRSYRLPSKTIALTFDDGPDPQWTPQVRRVLDRHGVDATFFVVGAQVARHPNLARQLVADGHELGVHTFTHPYLGRLPEWRRQLEYAQTQLAIAHATGVRTRLLRFPYSSQPEAVDDAEWTMIREAGRQGYVVVVNDTDSRDWARPGVEAIVRQATPPAGEGAVVLMHDAGGDRTQTVAALDAFIPAMQARGYRFTTVTEGLRLAFSNAANQVPALQPNPPATAGQRWRGAALVWTVQVADGLLILLTVLFLAAGLLTVGRTVLALVVAVRHTRRPPRHRWSWTPAVTEPVSVIVPAFNEREGIAGTVGSLVGSDHERVEVIVVDDGSTDGTAGVVEALDLPGVRMIRKDNGGKPSALNAGIAAASHDLIVMVDGDTVVEPDSIRRLVQPFADPRVGAVAGNVKVGNRRGLVACWQHIEYVIGFNLDRRLYELLCCMPTVPGALGAFRRTAVAEAGGLSTDTLAEDTDLTMAICRAGWKIVYAEDARAWTEAPATLAQLWKQRYRWSYGTMQAMWKHRRAITDGGPSGRFGRVGLPLLGLFGVILPLLAPVIDLLAVYGLVFLDRGHTALAWLAMLCLQFASAAIAFRLDGERLRPLWTLPLQQFAYRQLMYLVIAQSAATALAGARLRWHKLHRTGLATTTGGR